MGGLRRRTDGLKMDGWLEDGLVAKEEGLLDKSEGRLLVTVSFLESNSNCSPQQSYSKWPNKQHPSLLKKLK
jgi:hypothetical protein